MDGGAEKSRVLVKGAPLSIGIRGISASFGWSRFTGKERDAESGNDYFGARYYASSMGRFLSPDWSAKVEPVPYAKMDNPQSLNLYVYVGNNPLTRLDPDGHKTTCTGSGNNQQCTTTADTYDAAHSTDHRNIVATPEVRAAAEAGKNKVAVPLGDREKLGVIARNAKGKLEVQTINSTAGDTDAGNHTASAVPPPGTAAVIHGHIDHSLSGLTSASDGMVDNLGTNGGYGDSQPLTLGLPNATVSNGQIGWHEMVNGQLQFSYPGGAMTPGQQQQIQRNLDVEQTKF